MKFVDEALITVESGNGGRGCVSFRREKYVPKGGPDGGDGGVGGDVVFKATNQRRTLYHFRFQQTYSARNGEGGRGSQCNGANGDNITLEVPVGTMIYNSETGELIHDFTEHDEVFIVAKGGRGGKGNKFFTSSTHQTPRFAQPGEPGETLVLKLELKSIADVGIVGFPNAGKSTLISAISSARPKIADYPFTTLTPNIGIVSWDWGEPYAVADIPGLVEGAHTGVGLGIKFLRHVERTRILVHLIDAYEIDPYSPLERYEAINRELGLYSEELAEKEQIVVLNKMDISGAEIAAELFEEALGKPVFCISAATGLGVRELKNHLGKIVFDTALEKPKHDPENDDYIDDEQD
ncbi:GTPase ObgE [Desulforegula conservatrix]|uniref:GTPase ObgE n=1 Tax=Desulforegula conservatrix TaxID=153026 RepID=UPI000488A909|nr:GTPase ObgE [Desulforegula conservatrix]